MLPWICSLFVTFTLVIHTCTGSTVSGLNVRALTLSRESQIASSGQARQDDALEGCDNSRTCQCKMFACRCCAHLEAKEISLNTTGYVNVTYDLKKIGFEYDFSINDHVYMNNKTITVDNPSVICVAAPGLHKRTNVCLHFYNVYIKNKHVSSCINFEAELVGAVIKKIFIGCFSLPKYTFL